MTILHRSVRLTAPCLFVLAPLSSATVAQQVTSVCAAQPNSSGTTAAIDAIGSFDPVANLLDLECDGLPLQTFGVFMGSLAQQSAVTPIGSSGNLCIGPTFGLETSAIVNTGQLGIATIPLDLTNLAVGPGGATTSIDFSDVAYFQFWFRDRSVGSQAFDTSNFSNAIEVTFDGPPPPSFAMEIWPNVLDATNGSNSRCTSCHSGGSPSAGLSLATPAIAYAQMVGVPTTNATCAGPLRVSAGSAANSAILNLIDDAATCSGTTMTPPGGSADIDLVRAWIDAGAPNN